MSVASLRPAGRIPPPGFPSGRRLRAAAVLAVALAVGLAGAAAAATITVEGRGRATAEPDMASLTTGAVTTAKSAEEAVAANSKAVAEVIAAAKAAGIEPRDIRTARFSLQPQYSYPQSPSREAPRLVGFEVRNAVTVTVRDLSRLGPLLDRLVQAGANQASGLVFSVSAPEKLQEEARAAAVKDAMAQAKAVAEAAGLRLSRIVSIDARADGVAPPLPAPMLMKADARAAAVPVEAGEVEVGGHASLVYDAEPR